MRLLTFNSHQPYLHVLATALPWEVGVVIPQLPSGETRPWNPAVRPLPENVRTFPSLAKALREPRWDLAVAHNIHDLLELKDLDLPKIFVAHGTITGRIVQDGSSLDPREYAEQAHVLFQALSCQVVYISHLKREDWGLPGQVIETSFDAGPYGGYTGEVPGILQVSNHLRERGAILGWDAHAAVCQGLEHLVLGVNPALPGARPAEDWDDLRTQYRRYRVYLHTAVHPYEDGFNLALMEAMATGMPIATVEHPSSPITDGVDGVVAGSPAELRAKVMRLLDDPAEATRLGEEARRTFLRRFPLDRFREGWSEVAGARI